MCSFLTFLTIWVCVLALTWSAAVQLPQQENNLAEALLDQDSGYEHSNEGVRQARQLYGYYGRPFYGGYYGGYGYPYYGGYGFFRPYYGGGYYRPYYFYG